jgi:hypothetical protein
LTAARAKDAQAADRRATDAARLLNETDSAAAKRFADQYTKATNKAIDLSLPPYVVRAAKGDRTNRYISDEDASLEGTASPIANPEIRNDSGGSGAYLASRDGSERDHLGIDLKADSGTSDDGKFVDLMYVKRDDGLADGQRVTAGQTSLGTAQDLSTIYKNIGNHIHVQIYREDRGANNATREFYYDPEPMIFGAH